MNYPIATPVRLAQSTPIAPRKTSTWNVLSIAAVGAELAVLGSTAAVGFGLIAHSGNDALAVGAPIVVAATALELTRLPVVMRVPKLGKLGAVGALMLAAAVSCITAETMALGVDSLLTARSVSVAAAETRLSEAQTATDGDKVNAGRRDAERAKLAAAVDADQRHLEEVGREPVALQANPSVSAYRDRKGHWAAPGAGAANSIAAANAKTQTDHQRHVEAATADLAAARASLEALPPVDIKDAEEALVGAQQEVERERAANPLSRLAASIYRTDVANLKAEDYAAVRRVITLSLALLISTGTLFAGLISVLPDRDANRPSKLARSLRAYLARRRRKLTVRVPVPGPTQFIDRVVYIPIHADTGLPIDPNKAKAA